MLKLNSRQKFVVLFSILFVAVAFAAVLIMPKAELHVSVNKLGNPIADVFFRYWTILGDGTVMLIPAALTLIFYSYRKGLFLMAAYLFAGLGTQFMKRVVWPGEFRPVKYFELFYPEYRLHLVDGVRIHEYHSFPSGHTATAFAVFLALSLLIRSDFLRYFFILCAAGVGLSRVWISQHFMIDVAAGALWGIVSSLLAWYLLMNRNCNRLDHSLIKTLREYKKTKITT